MKFYNCMLLLSLVLCVSAQNWFTDAGAFIRDAYRGAEDMGRAFSDMREANYKNADKYFHARGNYDAAQRGPGGKWAAEVIRSSQLQSLLNPEALRLDWLCLAVSHDAPQRTNTVDSEGNPRPRSHLFTWGYSQLILLLIKLPADFVTKEKMTDNCKSYGFWPGYLSLCLELDRRIEAFTNIVHLDDMNLLDGERGSISETVEEWKFLLHLAQCRSTDFHCHGTQNGNTIGNGSTNWSHCITVENVALLLAKIIGPDRALPVLQECDLTAELSERFTRICEILRIAEKRQRALIQSMLERCDRFLWSQQA